MLTVNSPTLEHLRREHPWLDEAFAAHKAELEKYREALRRVRKIIADRRASDAVNAMAALKFIDATIGPT